MQTHAESAADKRPLFGPWITPAKRRPVCTLAGLFLAPAGLATEDRRVGPFAFRWMQSAKICKQDKCGACT